MVFLGKILGPFLYGRAAMQYARGNYDKAAGLFERAGSLEPKLKRVGYYHVLLGNCHLLRGETEEAVHTLLSAYRLLLQEDVDLHTAGRRREIVGALRSLKRLLDEREQTNEASKVAQELSRWDFA